MFGEKSLREDAVGIEFLRFQPGWFGDWHHAPRKQYIFVIAGQMEVGIGDGTSMSFGAGSVVLAEDLSGRGHTTRAIGDEPLVLAWVPLQA
jgi:quercetin dioxygenase-like cupin family protein